MPDWLIPVTAVVFVASLLGLIAGFCWRVVK